MTKQQILKKTGLSEEKFYEKFPTKEAWEMYANGGEVKKYANGGKLPKAVLRSRLEAHMSPNEAQNYINSYAKGGVVDVYQLMGMPTPAMYGRGSGIYIKLENRGKFTASANRAGMGVQEFARHVLANKEDYSSTQVKRANFARNAAKWKHEDGGPVHYIPSYAFGNIQSKNTTYNHGYANGGLIPMYDFGSVVKDIGAGAYGVLEGTLDTVTMGATDQLTDAGYKGLQKLGNSTEAEIRQQDSIHGYGQAAGAIAGAATNPASLGTAISEGTEGLGQGIAKGSPDSKTAQQIGTYLPMAGRIAGMATGSPAAGSAGAAKSAQFASSNIGQFAGKAGKVGQGYNTMNSGNPMQMMQMFSGQTAMAAGGPVYNPFLTPQMQFAQRSAINKQGTMMAAMGGAVNKPNMFKYADGGLLGMGGVNKFSNMFADGGLLGTMIPLAKPFMAMGGQVNYPQGLRKDMGNMPIFAEGSMTGNLTQINVEKGELLTDKSGKIVTEYRGGGMVPHPEEGMDERGTVPAQEGMFVITKAKAEPYKNAMKNNDKVYADSIRNNIAFDKARKEAKEEAAANTAYNKFAKKYGGAIQRMYAKGGMIPMYYDGAGVSNVIGPTVDPSFNVLGNNLSQNITPQINYGLGYGPKMAYNPAGRQGVDPQGNAVSINPSTSRDYQVPGMNTGDMYGSTWDQSPNYNPNLGQKGPGFGSNISKQDIYTGMSAAPIAWNVIQALKKPSKVPSFAMDTNLVAPKLSDRQGKREIIEQSNAAQRGIRNIGGSGVLPGMVALGTNRMKAIADYRENLDNRNATLGYDAASRRKAYEQFNADAAMRRYMMQAQADAVPTQYASAAAEGIGKMGDTFRYEESTIPYLKKVYPHLFS